MKFQFDREVNGMSALALTIFGFVHGERTRKSRKGWGGIKRRPETERTDSELDIIYQRFFSILLRTSLVS